VWSKAFGLALLCAALPAFADDAKWGNYTPNFGYKVVDTDKGDMSVSIYTYIRYLNQTDLDPTYTDAFGNVKTIQRRQDFQLQKVQIKFLGWLLNPKFRYFLYAWTANTSQGQGAQVVLAGNLNYTFNDHLTLSAGITSLPGVRTTEGNFPFWLQVDARMIADEFFRPSYTTGVWARGKITDTLSYQIMLGNNLSTLGVSAAQLDNRTDTVSSVLAWEPRGDFGLGFGDFEDHQQLALRLAAHYTSSTEDKQSQPNTDDFENTQIRLSDGTVIFTPNLFGPGITIERLFLQMANADAGIKYRGWSVDAGYYARWLSKFRGTGTQALPRRFDEGFQVQIAKMVIPKTLQLYVSGSRIDGEFGNPWDARVGVNWLPLQNKVLRWNFETMYLDHSPVGATAYPYAVGGTGIVFYTSFEMAL
jgi:hypothetical protein